MCPYRGKRIFSHWRLHKPAVHGIAQPPVHHFAVRDVRDELRLESHGVTHV